ALAMSIILLAAVSMIILALLARTTYRTQSTSFQINAQGAIQVAESGIEKVVYCLNTPTDTTNCPGNPNYVGESNVQIGNGTYDVAVSGAGDSRTVTATGTVKGLLGSSTKQIQTTLATTTTSVAFQ